MADRHSSIKQGVIDPVSENKQAYAVDTSATL